MGTSAAARWRRRAIALVGPRAVATERCGDWRHAIALIRVLGRVIRIEIVAETECHEELAIVVLDAGLLAPDLLPAHLSLKAERFCPIIVDQQGRKRCVL